MSVFYASPMLRFGVLVAIASTTSVFAADAIPLRDRDLPWDDLANQLSPTATMIEASNQDYFDQCYPEFENNPNQWDRKSNNLVNQEGGVCMNGFACGFKNCIPFDVEGKMIIADVLDDLNSAGPSNSLAVREWADPSNPTYNIPSTVLFPAVAGDVAAAVGFAADHMLELSVKASGHSYTGASTKSDTLLLNMNRDYKKYSPDGIVDCSDVEDDAEFDQDLSNQPCLMAIARDKPAHIRVGGGENFGEAYGSVQTFNKAQADYMYHLVGGAVTTVTPMGWTWQGGLSGTTGGRLFGFGVDQVLQIEAVLPNGEHVRFGPTSWEDQEGFQYPRTTIVSGVCNENPKEDESKWKWEPCPGNINFDDLWFAFRGGGGGTYGIVTSVYLMLHDYLPLETVSFGKANFLNEEGCNVTIEDFEKGIEDAFVRFQIDFLLDPSALGVSEEDSNACASPAGGQTPSMWCYGDGAGAVYILAWEKYILGMKESLLERGIEEDSIDKAASCLVPMSYDDYFQANGGSEGIAPSLLSSSTENDTLQNVLIPKSWVLSNKDKATNLLKSFGDGIIYWAFGGNTATAQDQSTSLSEAHREAAFMVFSHLDNEAVWELIQEFYDFTGENTGIPPYIGGNHVNPSIRGPLKSDPTKQCNYANFTQNEADENCYSTQEVVWGSETLARLEAIKEEIDPSYILDCQKCVGNNRVKSSISEGPTEAPQAKEEEDDKESIATTSPTTTTTSSGGFGTSHSSFEHMSSFFVVVSMSLNSLLG